MEMIERTDSEASKSLVMSRAEALDMISWLAQQLAETPEQEQIVYVIEWDDDGQ